MNTDVYLYEIATGRIIQRAIGEVTAITAMTNADVGVVPYEVGTSDRTHRVDPVSGQIEMIPDSPQ